MKIDSEQTNVSANQVGPVVHHPPWSNANGDDVVPALDQRVSQCISHMLHDTRVGAPTDDPAPSGLGSPQKSFTEDALQLRLHVEVGDASVDGDDQLGQIQSPLALQQLQQLAWCRVVRHPHVLGLVWMGATLELDGAVGVGRRSFSVLIHRPANAEVARSHGGGQEGMIRTSAPTAAPENSQ